MARTFRNFIKFTNHPLATIGLKIKQKLGLLSPPTIIPYRGFGNKNYAHVKGHVLENKLVYEAKEWDRHHKNIRGMLARYMSSQIPGVRVQGTFMGETQVAETDKKGYFEMNFNFKKPLEKEGWLPIQFEMVDQIVDDQDPVIVEGEVYIEESKSQYGIITDVDDTIIISRSTRVFEKLWIILTKNSKTRLPFKGVSDFYCELHLGTKGDFTNPVFYVSSSEWNLYDFLEDFCRVRQLPKGVFLLQDLKTSLWKLIKTGGGDHSHKEDKIRKLLTVYKDMNFVLIGDSGQHDAEIYSRITKDFPGRIKAIYIREVSKSRSVTVKEIADGVTEVDMLLIETTAMAHEHARKNGLIN